MSTPRLLICSPIPSLDPKLGAARVALDFAEGLQENGIPYDLYPLPHQSIERHEYAAHLKDFLPKASYDYDIIDYPFHTEPWIHEANPACLKVARIMLLPHHEDFSPDPLPPETLQTRLRALARLLLRREKPPLYSPQIRREMDANLQACDLINVANSADRDCLSRLGFDPRKIMVQPYGLTSAGFNRFSQEKIQHPKQTDQPLIAFVGTFDYRKGCLDFPEIIRQVCQAIPGARFRLLGTKGMMQTREKVLQFFPPALRPKLDIHPSFNPEELPTLLAECQAGIFPSYREGFGIAVVEMLAAGLPTLAYNAPGPCDILPPEWLVPPGDIQMLSSKALKLIGQGGSTNPTLRSLAINSAERFHWKNISLETFQDYSEAFHHKGT